METIFTQYKRYDFIDYIEILIASILGFILYFSISITY